MNTYCGLCFFHCLVLNKSMQLQRTDQEAQESDPKEKATQSPQEGSRKATQSDPKPATRPKEKATQTMPSARACLSPGTWCGVEGMRSMGLPCW